MMNKKKAFGILALLSGLSLSGCGHGFSYTKTLLTGQEICQTLNEYGGFKKGEPRYGWASFTVTDSAADRLGFVGWKIPPEASADGTCMAVVEVTNGQTAKIHIAGPATLTWGLYEDTVVPATCRNTGTFSAIVTGDLSGTLTFTAGPSLRIDC